MGAEHERVSIRNLEGFPFVSVSPSGMGTSVKKITEWFLEKKSHYEPSGHQRLPIHASKAHSEQTNPALFLH